MAIKSFSDIELALTSTALAGDAGGLYRIASELMDEGVPFDSVLFDYLIPTEAAVGARWERGDYLIAEEHAATAAIETVVSLLTGMFDRPKDGTSVVVATAEGDDHSLPARVAAAYLLFLGYRTTFLGASVPGSDLKEFLETEAPAVVVLSSAMTGHLVGAHAVISASHAVGIPVVAGGQAFGAHGEWAYAVGADVWVPTLHDVADAIEQMLAEPEFGPVDTPPVPDDLHSLISARSAILADAEEEIVRRTGGVDDRLRDEIRILESTVEAAQLVGDEQIISDMLKWQRQTLEAHDYEGDVVAMALKEVISHRSPSSATMLDNALGAR